MLFSLIVSSAAAAPARGRLTYAVTSSPPPQQHGEAVSLLRAGRRRGVHEVPDVALEVGLPRRLGAGRGGVALLTAHRDTASSA